MTSANVGNLTGNSAFWASDYMVHRRDSYVQAVKLLSTRSLNTEAINGANPYGFHLGVGSLFTYASGSEYRDIQAAWDWNLVPGTTSLLNLPSLNTARAQLRGVKNFVGTVSDGWDGMAIMDFAGSASNPQISYRKVYFFLDDVVLVTTSSIQVRSDVSSLPVIAVLDNRRRSSDGVVLVEDQQQASTLDGVQMEGSTLWHDDTGYLSYSKPFSLTLASGDRSGNWSGISTSAVGVTMVPIFSAYTKIEPDIPSYTYAIFPASDRTRVQEEANNPTYTPLDLGPDVSAVTGAGKLAIVFWTSGQSARIPLSSLEWPAGEGSTDILVITSSQPAGYLLTLDNSSNSIALTLSDPTQVLSNVAYSLSIDGAGRGFGCAATDGCSATTGVVSVTATMPSGGFAGQSISTTLDIF